MCPATTASDPSSASSDAAAAAPVLPYGPTVLVCDYDGTWLPASPPLPSSLTAAEPQSAFLAALRYDISSEAAAAGTGVALPGPLTLSCELKGAASSLPPVGCFPGRPAAPPSLLAVGACKNPTPATASSAAFGNSYTVTLRAALAAPPAWATALADAASGAPTGTPPGWGTSPLARAQLAALEAVASTPGGRYRFAVEAALANGSYVPVAALSVDETAATRAAGARDVAVPFDVTPLALGLATPRMVLTRVTALGLSALPLTPASASSADGVRRLTLPTVTADTATGTTCGLLSRVTPALRWPPVLAAADARARGASAAPPTRLLVSDGLPPAPDALSLSLPVSTGPGESLSIACTAAGALRSKVTITPSEVTLSGPAGSAVNFTVAGVFTRGSVAAGSDALTSGQVVCVVRSLLSATAAGAAAAAGSSSSSSSTSPAYESHTVAIDTRWLSTRWPLLGDVLLETASGGLRSAWAPPGVLYYVYDRAAVLAAVVAASSNPNASSSLPLPAAWGTTGSYDVYATSTVSGSSGSATTQTPGTAFFGTVAPLPLWAIPAGAARADVVAALTLGAPPDRRFSLSLPSQDRVNLTLVADAAQWLGGGGGAFTPTTRFRIGGVEATVLGVAADGSYARVSLPVAGRLSSRRLAATAGGLALEAANVDTVTPAELVTLARGGEDAVSIASSLASSGRRLGSLVACKPLCPGAGAASAVPAVAAATAVTTATSVMTTTLTLADVLGLPGLVPVAAPVPGGAATSAAGTGVASPAALGLGGVTLGSVEGVSTFPPACAALGYDDTALGACSSASAVSAMVAAGRTARCGFAPPLSPPLSLQRYIDTAATNNPATTGVVAPWLPAANRTAALAAAGGAVCYSCPSGAVCPAAGAALPLPGYWAPETASGLITRCAHPPLERCAGYDAASGAIACGTGYSGFSSACSACAPGYYPAADSRSYSVGADGKTLWQVLAGVGGGSVDVTASVCAPCPSSNEGGGGVATGKAVLGGFFFTLAVGGVIVVGFTVLQLAALGGARAVSSAFCPRAVAARAAAGGAVAGLPSGAKAMFLALARHSLRVLFGLFIGLQALALVGRALPSLPGAPPALSGLVAFIRDVALFEAATPHSNCLTASTTAVLGSLASASTSPSASSSLLAAWWGGYQLFPLETFREALGLALVAPVLLHVLLPSGRAVYGGGASAAGAPVSAFTRARRGAALCFSLTRGGLALLAALCLPLLFLLLAPILDAAFAIVGCNEPTLVPVRVALGMHGDGSSLVAAGVPCAQGSAGAAACLSLLPSDPALDALLPVTTTILRPDVLCWEAPHASAVRLAIAVFVCVAGAFPLALALLARGGRREVATRAMFAVCSPLAGLGPLSTRLLAVGHCFVVVTLAAVGGTLSKSGGLPFTLADSRASGRFAAIFCLLMLHAGAVLVLAARKRSLAASSSSSGAGAAPPAAASTAAAGEEEAEGEGEGSAPGSPASSPPPSPAKSAASAAPEEAASTTYGGASSGVAWEVALVLLLSLAAFILAVIFLAAGKASTLSPPPAPASVSVYTSLTGLTNLLIALLALAAAAALGWLAAPALALAVPTPEWLDAWRRRRRAAAGWHREASGAAFGTPGGISNPAFGVGGGGSGKTLLPAVSVQPIPPPPVPFVIPPALQPPGAAGQQQLGVEGGLEQAYPLGPSLTLYDGEAELGGYAGAPGLPPPAGNNPAAVLPLFSNPLLAASAAASPPVAGGYGEPPLVGERHIRSPTSAAGAGAIVLRNGGRGGPARSRAAFAPLVAAAKNLSTRNALGSAGDAAAGGRGMYLSPLVLATLSKAGGGAGRSGSGLTRGPSFVKPMASPPPAQPPQQQPFAPEEMENGFSPEARGLPSAVSPDSPPAARGGGSGSPRRAVAGSGTSPALLARRARLGPQQQQ